MYGPRSLIRTTCLRWFRTFTTRTIDPRGRVGWAAVSAYMSYVSPLAVCWPSKSSPYQLVVHSQIARGLGWLELALALLGAVTSALPSWKGLPGFPGAVGFAVGVNTSMPTPKNTVCKITKCFVFIVS